MNKKFILSLLAVILISYSAGAFATDDLNTRLRNCTPTKDYNAGGSTYQITGLTGSTCIFKILTSSTSKPDLICKVPLSKMYDMTSFNPLVVQGVKNKYCIMSIRSFKKAEKVYY